MEELLQRPVTLHGVLIGHVVDVIFEATEGQPMGLEVRCTEELDFYRERGVPLRRGRESAA